MENSVVELLQLLEDCPTIGSRWRHYKGQEYIVVGRAIDEASLLPVVQYQAVDYTPSVCWSRPLASWNEVVSDGVRRFIFLRE